MQKRIHTKNHVSKTNKRDLNTIFNKINNNPRKYDRRINRFANWHNDYIRKAIEKFRAKFGKKELTDNVVQVA